MFYCVAEVIFVGFAFAVPYWRHLNLYFLAIPMLVLIIPHYWLQETPKFVYETDQNKCVDLLNKIAVYNGNPKVQYDELEKPHRTDEVKDKHYTMVDLFRYKSLRLITYICCWLFFAIHLIYYGITFTLNGVGLNLHANTLVVGGAEVLSYGMANIFIPYLRRK